MAASAKGVAGAGDTEKKEQERKEKERKREEKELRRVAKAAGVRMAKPVATSVAPVVPPSPPLSGFKKSGWATVLSVDPPAIRPPPSTTRKEGWASVGSSSNTQPTGPSGGLDSISSSSFVPSPPEPSSRNMTSGPAFRAAGWASLDTGSSQPPLSSLGPIRSSPHAPPPPAYLPPPSSPYSAHATSLNPQHERTFPASASRDQQAAPPPPPPASHNHPQTQPPPPPVKSSWQKWNSGSSKRR
jgi:hypothetical protein